MKNDYRFGNYLCELRRKAGLTQKAVAASTGTTNKAVSKWENGAAKPSVDSIRKLAKLYGVSVDELLDLRDENPGPKITRIVLTGGPCAGKTTGQNWIQNAFNERGYRVIFVPETASDLIANGVRPDNCGSNFDFQMCQMQLQAEKERIYLQAARSMKVPKVLLVHDRGFLDNKAYMTDAEFSAILHRMGTSEVALRDSYDAVFHLVTAAKGAEDCYKMLNEKNVKRESREEAAALDDKIISAWTGHPHFRVIGNDTSFEAKMRRLITEIAAFLGEPEPFEVERKFLIRMPDVRALEKVPSCTCVDIIQTYLRSKADEEVRVRQRGTKGDYVCYKTIKRSITPEKRIEIEQRLSDKEYLSLLMDADTEKRQIRKTRYCLTWGGHYYEIDIFPFWKDQAMVEIELNSEDEKFDFPPFLEKIREVTKDPAYKNAALAARKDL